MKPLFEKDSTYSLRGVCMLMIIASHIPYTMDGTIVSKLLHILLFDYWGAFGTALFFLLSGYGMFLSLHKTKDVNTSYVTNKLKKLFMPFLFTWMVYLVYFLLMDRSQLNQHLLMDFLTISLPYGIDIWFFKVIIGLYVAIILLFKLPISDILRIIVMFIMVFGYYIIMRGLSFEPWWYNSVLCFPLGMLFASRKELVKNNSLSIFMIVGCFILSMVTTIGFFPYITFALCAVWFVRVVNINAIPGLKFIGINSLLYYLFECPCVSCLEKTFASNAALYYLITLVLTTLLAIVYLNLKRIAGKLA